MPHALELLALTTTEIGLVTTAVVGVAAAAAPTFTAWANRRHERDLAQSARLYAQRHGAYLELARFLEHERFRLERIEPIIGPAAEPPDPFDDEAWIEMRVRWVTLASDDVKAALEVALTRYSGFGGAVMTLRGLLAQGAELQLADARINVQNAREGTRAAFDAAEAAMNSELATF